MGNRNKSNINVVSIHPAATSKKIVEIPDLIFGLASINQYADSSIEIVNA